MSKKSIYICSFKRNLSITQMIEWMILVLQLLGVSNKQYNITRTTLLYHCLNLSNNPLHLFVWNSSKTILSNNVINKFKLIHDHHKFEIFNHMTIQGTQISLVLSPWHMILDVCCAKIFSCTTFLSFLAYPMNKQDK